MAVIKCLDLTHIIGIFMTQTTLHHSDNAEDTSKTTSASTGASVFNAINATWQETATVGHFQIQCNITAAPLYSKTYYIHLHMQHHSSTVKTKLVLR